MCIKLGKFRPCGSCPSLNEQSIDYWLKIVSAHGRALEYVNPRFRSVDVCFAAVSNNGLALVFVPPNMRGYKICLQAVSTTPEALQFVPNVKNSIMHSSEHYEVHAAAISLDGLMLHYSGYDCEDLNIMAILENPQALKYVKQPTLEIYAIALSKDPTTLKLMPPQDRRRPESRHLCVIALSEHPTLLRYIDDQTKTEIMVAVQADGLALQYAEFQTEFICKIAVMDDGRALQYVVNQTEEICELAVSQNAEALGYVHQQTEKIRLAAMREDPVAAFPYVHGVPSPAVLALMPKPTETKPVESKPVEPKAVEPKPAETKPVESKPAELKPAESKPVEPKPVETKPIESKPVEPKPVKLKAVEPKPVESTPAESISDLVRTCPSCHTNEIVGLHHATTDFNGISKLGVRCKTCGFYFVVNHQSKPIEPQPAEPNLVRTCPSCRTIDVVVVRYAAANWGGVEHWGVRCKSCGYCFVTTLAKGIEPDTPKLKHECPFCHSDAVVVPRDAEMLSQCIDCTHCFHIAPSEPVDADVTETPESEPEEKTIRVVRPVREIAATKKPPTSKAQLSKLQAVMNARKEMDSVMVDGINLKYVMIKTPSICLAAVKQSWEAVQFVPRNMLTNEMCQIAVTQSDKALNFIPPSMLSDKLIEIVNSQEREF